MYELKGKLEIFMENIFSYVLITVSMNFFDQLVITTCDSVMEG